MLNEIFILKGWNNSKLKHEQQQHKIRARLDERGTFIEHTFLPFHLFLFDQPASTVQKRFSLITLRHAHRKLCKHLDITTQRNDIIPKGKIS